MDMTDVLASKMLKQIKYIYKKYNITLLQTLNLNMYLVLSSFLLVIFLVFFILLGLLCVTL